MRKIAFRKTFLIGTLIVVAPGIHKPNALSQSLLDVADKLAANCLDSKIFEDYCKILL